MKDDEKTDKSGVPQITLIDNKGEHRGVQGSYCWNGICIDYTMPSNRVDFHEKLLIPKDTTIAFNVAHPIGLGQLHITIFLGNKIVLHKPVNKHMKVQIPTGEYFLNAKATWKGQGDSSNVFLIKVV